MKPSPITVCGVGLLATSLTGCRQEPPTDLAGAPAASVPTAEQTQVEQTAQAYVKTLQSKDFAGAEALMSPTYQATMPVGKLKSGVDREYKPLTTATAFQFDPAELTPNHAQIVLRAQFHSGDNKLYRTNFLFSRSGSAWLISKVVPPASRPHASVMHEKSG